MKKLYIYLDESGSIHPNSNCKYFAVGGYYSYNKRSSINNIYCKIVNEIKKKKNCNKTKELKSYNLSDDNKINIFKNIELIDDYKGIIKIFDKRKMNKSIMKYNLFYNYSIKILLLDEVFKDVQCNKMYIYLDFRTVDKKYYTNLEYYLNKEFNHITFKVRYCDSKRSYGIQLADLIVNTFYNVHKDYSIVAKVMKVMNIDKYSYSIFPYKKESKVFIKNIDLY